MMISNKNLFCSALALVIASAVSQSVAAKQEVHLSLTEKGKANLVVFAGDQLVVGQTILNSEYTTFALSVPAQTREAAAGSGIIGGSAPIGGGDAPIGVGDGPNHWGYAEVLVHCNAADVIVYAYDVNGQAIEVDAQQLETSYCPLTK